MLEIHVGKIVLLDGFINFIERCGHIQSQFTQYIIGVDSSCRMAACAMHEDTHTIFGKQ